MSLNIDTFTNRNWRPGNNFGGNTLFKALGHPLTAAKARSLVAEIAAKGPLAVHDPLGEAGDFNNFYNLEACDLAGVFVQDLEDIGAERLGHTVRPVTELAACDCKTVLVAAFDAARLMDNIRHMVPQGAQMVSFDDARLPDDMLTNSRNYLAPINFATNFAFLRDGGSDHTRVFSANYWGGYGAKEPELWLCLFDEGGGVLAEWREQLPHAGGSYVIDSAQVRERFGLGDFTGTLFIHALRIAGHDIVKYALDTYGDDDTVLSCSHDANAWPADLYAGMPAPDDGEKVILWIQNSHPVPIPEKGIGLNAVGSQDVHWLEEAIPPFGTHALDVSTLLPEASWPTQIEIQAGRYFVRPRYEVVTKEGRRRIAHANVERTDLECDPRIPELGDTMGKGYIMPLPVLPVAEFTTTALPTPMATCQRDLPLSAILVDGSGEEIDRRFLGCIPRRESHPVDVDAWIAETEGGLPSGYGHVEFVYDFSNGGEADGWLHGFCRYQQRKSGHMAETIFGAHIYNTALTYKDEPQSYATRPPGLSTRIFLRLGNGATDTMCHLIYPASTPWHETSDTRLILHNARGEEVAERTVNIPCGGSLHWRYGAMFDDGERKSAGDNAYVLVRDVTCRLFGYHGLVNDGAAFCLDHMFGF